MTRLKPDTEAALDAWLSPHTWDSDQGTDRIKFYQFVHQYAVDHGHTLNESETREIIKRKVTGRDRAYGDSQDELVHRNVRLGINILEFLSATASSKKKPK